MICAGVDSGSRPLKIVLLEAEGRAVAASGVVDQGVDQEALAGELLVRLLRQVGLGRAHPATDRVSRCRDLLRHVRWVCRRAADRASGEGGTPGSPSWRTDCDDDGRSEQAEYDQD